jgi:hypothetical protein
MIRAPERAVASAGKAWMALSWSVPALVASRWCANRRFPPERPWWVGGGSARRVPARRAPLRTAPGRRRGRVPCDHGEVVAEATIPTLVLLEATHCLSYLVNSFGPRILGPTPPVPPHCVSCVRLSSLITLLSVLFILRAGAVQNIALWCYERVVSREIQSWIRTHCSKTYYKCQKM